MAGTRDDEELREALLELEQAGWESLREGTGSDFYGRTMTDDGLMVLANGQVMTRDEVVAALAGSPPWASFSLEDVRLVHAGADAAALVYLGRAQREEGPVFVGAMSSVYARQPDGTWRLALYQQTAVT